MTAPLCLYLHSQIHNVDQAATYPHFPKAPQEKRTQPYEQQKQNRQKSWLHQQSDESSFQEEISFEIGSWVTIGNHEKV